MKKIIKLFIVLGVLIAASSPFAGIAQTNSVALRDSLSQLRQARQVFNEAKKQEATARQKAAGEKIRAKRQDAEKNLAEIQKRREEHQKTVLLRLVDAQIKHLNQTKERVGRMPNISASLKEELNSEIDKDVRKLAEEKAKIQNAGTSEELKALAKEARSFFKSYSDTVKRIVDAIHLSRAENALSKTENRLAAIKARVEELKSAGKDAGALEAELGEAEKNIGDSKSAIGRQAFKEATDALKEAYKKFRDITSKAENLE